MEPLRKLSPDTGSYLNEVYSPYYLLGDILNEIQAFPYEPDWQQSFWGSNYERLVEINRRVDPDDILW